MGMYYNGTLLPDIPKDVLAEYPYAWIRKNGSTGYYDLLFSKQRPWYSIYDYGVCYGTLTGECSWYRVSIANAGAAEAWEFNTITTNYFTIDTSRTVLWSLYDVPYGSETATVFYIRGSEPVDETSYEEHTGKSVYHNGLVGFMLPAIPKEVVYGGYPYTWIRWNKNTGECILVCLPNGGRYNGSAVWDEGYVPGPRYRVTIGSNAESWEYVDSANAGYSVEESYLKVLWSNHDIPGESATDVYCYAQEPIPEDSIKTTKIDHKTYSKFYVGPNEIYYDGNAQAVNYVVPVEKNSQYVVSMHEVGNRLRVAFTATDPATITANVSATNVVYSPAFFAGYTFYAIAPEAGWLVVYVSNAGETPDVSIAQIGGKSALFGTAVLDGVALPISAGMVILDGVALPITGGMTKTNGVVTPITM